MQLDCVFPLHLLSSTWHCSHLGFKHKIWFLKICEEDSIYHYSINSIVSPFSGILRLLQLLPFLENIFYHFLRGSLLVTHSLSFLPLRSIYSLFIPKDIFISHRIQVNSFFFFYHLKNVISAPLASMVSHENCYSSHCSPIHNGCYLSLLSMCFLCF